MKNIRKYLLAVAILAAHSLFAQHYTPVDEGSAVKFKIKNFGITVGGSFAGLQGTIRFDPLNPGSSSFETSVSSASINTGIGARDNHLRKEDYFNVKQFDKITIRSIRITPANKEGWLFFFGTLTIKGVSKEISFPFQATEHSGGYIFSGEFKINRRDFGVGGNSISLADNLTVNLNVFAKKS